jgi:hypothetical protein
MEHRDAGMTLPELLISVTLTGVLAGTLALATNVMLSNRENVLGRANNSRSEQNVGFFMPTDLASSESEDTDPWTVPCGPEAGPDHLPAPPCPPGAMTGGSNALQLTWTSSVIVAGNPVTTTTKVSYRVVFLDAEYQLVRVKCETVGTGGPTCNTQIVLHNLTPPPANVTFVPGVTKADWIITVSKATDPADQTINTIPATVTDPGFTNKNGQRVVVTINGGGGGTNLSGGQSQIFLSAGGTNREASLSTETLVGAPQFTAARSRCGGNIGMVVDVSGSISAAQMKSIKAGIRTFLDEFAGTPVKLQVVTFDTTGLILGSTNGEPHWFDMLVDNDVATLKNLIGDPNDAASGIAPGAYTNWEDGFLRMLKNKDGTTPQQLPSKVIFFTDGVPTASRLNGTTSTAPVTADPLDTQLPTGLSSSFLQVGWNRAERVVRDRGKIDVIGIFVGTLPGTSDLEKASYLPANAYSTWKTVSAGYHFVYERGDTVVYQRGYHGDYQRGNNVVFQRGYHTDYQRGNNVVFQYATSGVSFERFASGSWQTESASNYLSKNTTPDSTDNHRIRVTGTLGGWTTMSSSQYDTSNAASGEAEGVRTITSGSATSWTSVTQAQYNLSNTTVDASDGWQIANAYSSPFSAWENTTQAAYDTGNTVAGNTDGWQTITSGSASSWTAITAAQYNASNTTADATDGWQTINVYTSPFSSWENTTQAAYDTGNTVAANTDGWQTITSGSATSWASVTATQYNASNTTADATDGWQVANVYTSPYSSWETTSQTAYEAGNTVAANTDGWQTVTSGAVAAWTAVTSAQYNASNTTTDATDGWRTSKSYTLPYTNYDTTTKKISNIDLLGNVVVGDLTGGTGAYNRVDAPAAGQDYPENAAAAADVFALPDYTNFTKALDKIVLGECGGTITLQTKNIADGLGARDPFTYENVTDGTGVKTSAAFKSGTFDVTFPGAPAKTVTIRQQAYTTLNSWTHQSWSCKSKGAPYPFVEKPNPDLPGWPSIEIVVHANEAISCTQVVKFA